MLFSETKQSFKIGRMTYSLPERVVIEKGADYSLSFTWLPLTKEWSAYYRHLFNYESILVCREPTFNKALKALHVKIKEHQTQSKNG